MKSQDSSKKAVSAQAVAATPAEEEVHEEEGEEKLHLLMVDNHIPAGAKLY